ncbi:toprim domain-containing protein [Cupriavidus pauculus]|uniref:toprim domain-containing protein n=1 Tax=Cupriavidus pauculus TaxID=82633 RepID=UPI0015DEDC74|nr:toprim domain-containing protein [Cupriavidus pauculus]
MPDGKVHRFRTEEDRPGQRSGWYVSHGQRATLGDFRRGDWCANWHASVPLPSPLRRARVTQIRANSIGRVQPTPDTRFAERFRAATQVWHRHDYLRRKGVNAGGLLRVEGQLLLVPLRTMTDDIAGLQTIDPTGNKRFVPGSSIKGNGFQIGRIDTRDTTPHAPRLLICEGVATGLSLHACTGLCTVVAMNCGNLLHVALRWHALYPGAVIVVCADDDDPTSTGKSNPGITHALAAASAIGGRVCWPVFSFPVTGKSDFNDMHLDEGAASVADRVFAVVEGLQ